MKKLICVLLSAVMLLSLCITAGAEENGELRFSDSGKFKILQISDTQDDHHPAYDMLNLIKISIEQTQPDLIVFTGDIVEDSRVGDFGVDDENGREGVTVDDYDQTVANVKVACDAVFAAVEEAGIPFAVTQGNNDYRSGVKNEDWLKLYSQYKNCLVRDESPDEDGRIDYNLEIKGSDGSTKFNLWLMDTRGSSVNGEQIEWYKNESAALKAANGGEPVPSFVFQHINTSDIGNLFEECNFWDEGASISDGKCYRLNQDIASGFHSGAIAPGQTSEQFKAWKECGDVLGAYFGHWHTEGYTGVWDGIELGFTYGAEFAKPGPYGIRVFTLYEDDIENYDNELYTYEGSVKKGNARLELQVDEPYKTYDNFFEKLIAAVMNTFSLLGRQITSLLS